MRTFTKKIPEVAHIDYWSRLKELKMLSQQRRSERYRIIYTWKFLEGMVPNSGIQAHFSEHRGRECVIPEPKGRLAVQATKLPGAGPKLFNILPAYLRNMKKS